VKDHDYRHILVSAAKLFDSLAPLPLKTWMDEREGECFHLSVELRKDLTEEKWREAIIALAEAVNAKGRDYVLEPLDCPRAVEFSERHGALLMIVAYVPPTCTEDGQLVPGYESCRFDVRGIAYGR
jgi:hypothetical protein